MNITAKCCCGANVDIQPGRTGYGNNTSAQDEQRVMEVFEKWTEKHQNCSSAMAEAQRPTFKFPEPMRWPREEVPAPTCESPVTNSLEGKS